MKKLCELVACEYDIPIERITDDSRIKGDNILFCAAKGFNTDGHDYAADAVKNGAVAVICERPLGLSVPEIIVENSPLAMNMALNAFYGKPLDAMKLVGVTGTDGKTTTTTIVYEILSSLSRCGLIGTERIACHDFDELQVMTTPFPSELFAALDRFNKCGCEYVALEASSERLGSKRLDGLEFAASIFTNISNEHFNTHGTLENYAAAKARLFEHTRSDGVCVIYNEDAQSEFIKSRSNGKVITFGRTSDSDLWFDEFSTDTYGLEFTLHGIYGERRIKAPIVGEFNALNIIAASAAVISLGFEPDDVFSVLDMLVPANGRQWFVREGQPFNVIIDFTHTGNALRNLSKYARQVSPGKLYMVLGTGGNRTLVRQTELGCAAIDNADFAWLTTDHPRGEEPLHLCENMLLEADTSRGNFEIELDRRAAIFKAVALAEEGDALLITGMGTEKFRLDHGVRVPYIGDYANVADAIHEKYKNK